MKCHNLDVYCMAVVIKQAALQVFPTLVPNFEKHTLNVRLLGGKYNIRHQYQVDAFSSLFDFTFPLFTKINTILMFWIFHSRCPSFGLSLFHCFLDTVFLLSFFLLSFFVCVFLGFLNICVLSFFSFISSRCLSFFLSFFHSFDYLFLWFFLCLFICCADLLLFVALVC